NPKFSKEISQCTRADLWKKSLFQEKCLTNFFTKSVFKAISLYKICRYIPYFTKASYSFSIFTYYN
ncbi:MAG: hypothetical protein ACTSVL_02090, partial [Promethearchaeota archaeon]